MDKEPQDDTQRRQHLGECKDYDFQPASASMGIPSTIPGNTTMTPAMASAVNNLPSHIKLPRVAITFCTQCKWMLRAAYFGQELLSTFGSAIGEIALIPATGGLFQVNVTHLAVGSDRDGATKSVKEVLLWDRKSRGGFPETKVLKQLVRDVIEPEKGLGHSDAPGKGNKKAKESKTEADGDAGRVAEEFSVQTAESGLGTSVAVSALAQMPLLANAGGKDHDSSRNNSNLRILTPMTASIPIDPLLEDANATPAMVDLTQQHSVDPLLQTAITSPTIKIEEQELSPKAETQEDTHLVSPSVVDIYTTVKAPLTWQDEGIPP